jgi:hypothetical protein
MALTNREAVVNTSMARYFHSPEASQFRKGGPDLCRPLGLAGGNCAVGALGGDRRRHLLGYQRKTRPSFFRPGRAQISPQAYV